jgi:hypothetical protein
VPLPAAALRWRYATLRQEPGPSMLIGPATPCATADPAHAEPGTP